MVLAPVKAPLSLNYDFFVVPPLERDLLFEPEAPRALAVPGIVD